MPTYDYACQACEHQFEAFQSINDKPLKKCPKCGKPKLQRQFGPGGGLIFKGSGFYITDYRSPDYKKKAEAEQKSGSTAGTGDSKPAAGGESSPAPAAKESAAAGESTPKSGKKESKASRSKKD